MVFLCVYFSGQKIALIGALANDKNSPLGSWRIASDDNTAVSVLEGMQKYKGNVLTFEKGADLTVGKTTFIDELVFNTTDKSGFDAAKKVAASADVVVMVLGEHGFQSGEGRSRTNLDLPGVQQELLEEVYKVNPNITVVLVAGSSLAINWMEDKIPAIVNAWYPGEQGGKAVAEVLFGCYNPAGRLPLTYYSSLNEVPAFDDYDVTKGRGYQYFKEKPLYPFGYGLSYTSFVYKNLRLTENNEFINLVFDLKNAGKMDGDEVSQVYVKLPETGVIMPIKELKGFKRSFKRG